MYFESTGCQTFRSTGTFNHSRVALADPPSLLIIVPSEQRRLHERGQQRFGTRIEEVTAPISATCAGW